MNEDKQQPDHSEPGDASRQTPNPRAVLARKTAVLQLKLLADGFRDAVLIPISLVAGLIGIMRGGDDAEREFHQVIKLGRRSERWINLFGHHRPFNREHPAGSLDALVDKVEDVVREQYRKGSATQEARNAIEKALEDLQSASSKRDDSVEK